MMSTKKLPTKNPALMIGAARDEYIARNFKGGEKEMIRKYLKDKTHEKNQMASTLPATEENGRV